MERVTKDGRLKEIRIAPDMKNKNNNWQNVQK